MSRPTAASRSRCSSPAPSCFISPTRPASSSRKDFAAASRRSNGCSGRWAVSARWPGQNNHFSNYAADKIQYAMDRYRNEVNRLYGVMNKRLADRQFLAGEYSIADMACYPWVVPWERQGQNIADFPHLQTLVRGDQGAARGGQGLRMDAEDQSRPGRHPHRRRARHPVRSDRAIRRRWRLKCAT